MSASGAVRVQRRAGTIEGPGVRPPRLVAHRGAPRVRRENTLPAVAAAVALGAETVEVDVRRTADGVALLLHDETLDRLWGDPRRVEELPWSDVARLGDDRDRVPRLDEVLDLLRGGTTTLLVDVTSVADAVVAARTVAAHGTPPAVAWCGSRAAVTAVRSVLPDADVWLAWASLAGPTADDLDDLAPSTLNLDLAFLTPDVVTAAHALGLRVAVWTVDEAAPAAWAAALGVDSITTNDLPAVRAACSAGQTAVPPAVEDAVEDARVLEGARVLARSIADEVVVLTRTHPVGEVAAKAHPADLVTDVDRRVEQFVRGRVRSAFPLHGFTGEEFGTSPGDRHHWYLDPVDGTTNLANGLPWTALSLCLVRAGQPVVGVVADPWRGEVLEAQRGRGAVLGDRRLRLDREPRTLVGTVVGTELDGHRPWPGMDAFLHALADRSCTLRIQGSGTLTIAQVAAGRGVGGCVGAFSPVDHGAAVLLVHEAGGVVVTRSGTVADGFPPDGEPFLVAHPGVVDELGDLWRAALDTAG
ncbi:inositol monophosphatase family protein [Curtobacterium sp. MCBA15_012]|uniref:inositol monophosphatase family protein n=1 Tax=Curtobacterium sp. MCBA15_012 TaxID=1898738 RepID=UPI0009F2A475|nr:inositol monophosphatase family protein [Curtobacterium sp. MCBA15_012]WIB00401.1 inositol monophosphatase family protein [Curtobacterium sp. MCBA15_012]